MHRDDPNTYTLSLHDIRNHDTRYFTVYRYIKCPVNNRSGKETEEEGGVCCIESEAAADRQKGNRRRRGL